MNTKEVKFNLIEIIIDAGKILEQFERNETLSAFYIECVEFKLQRIRKEYNRCLC